MSKFKRINVDDAEWLMSQHDNLLLLDCRDIRAFCQSHHPHAVHLNDSNLRAIIKNTPKDIHLVIYCYHGNSSQDMAQLFADFGFDHCYSVDGGYEAWRSSILESQIPTSRLLAAEPTCAPLH